MQQAPYGGQQQAPYGGGMTPGGGGGLQQQMQAGAYTRPLLSSI
jgi:hypothetical protein